MWGTPTRVCYPTHRFGHRLGVFAVQQNDMIFTSTYLVDFHLA